MSPRQLSNGPFFITTNPSLIPCGKCRAPVLAATVGGIDRHVDLHTLNDKGELIALLENRATYDLRGELLVQRHTEQIAAGRPWPVLADHACKPTPDRYVDHIWDDVGVALIHQLMGGTTVLPANPPF